VPENKTLICKNIELIIFDASLALTEWLIKLRQEPKLMAQKCISSFAGAYFTECAGARAGKMKCFFRYNILFTIRYSLQKSSFYEGHNPWHKQDRQILLYFVFWLLTTKLAVLLLYSLYYLH
jgi:hypothetical protein